MLLIHAFIGPSEIHGTGLFARRSIPRGTPVWRFVDGFDLVFSPSDFAALPEAARMNIGDHCFIAADDGGSRILGGDQARYMNHSDEPNTGARPEAVPPVTTVALRDIAAGEELTCNYFHFDGEAARKLAPVSRAAKPA